MTNLPPLLCSIHATRAFAWGTSPRDLMDGVAHVVSGPEQVANGKVTLLEAPPNGNEAMQRNHVENVWMLRSDTTWASGRARDRQSRGLQLHTSRVEAVRSTRGVIGMEGCTSQHSPLLCLHNTIILCQASHVQSTGWDSVLDGASFVLTVPTTLLYMPCSSALGELHDHKVCLLLMPLQIRTCACAPSSHSLVVP